MTSVSSYTHGHLGWRITKSCFGTTYLKSDHRLGRNFLKGVAGDAVNVLLAAAAFNFKRMMNKWRRLLPVFASGILRLFMPAPFRMNTHAA